MALTIDNTASFVQTVSGTSHTSTITLGSGTSRKIIVIGFIENSGTTLSGATFDGNSMTAITSVTNPGDSAERMYSWYYDVSDGTGTGSKTITVTSGFSNADVTWYAWQLSGAATGACEYGAGKTSDNTVTTVSDSSVAVSSGAAIMAVASTGSPTPTWSWTNLTERTESNETSYTTCCADTTGATVGTKTITATASTTAGYKNLITVSVAPTSGSSLTDVDSDETIVAGQDGVLYTGTGLTNAVSFLVKTGTKSAAATNFVATNATSGMFSAPSLSAVLSGGVKFGSVTFDIRDSGASLGTLSGTLNPISRYTVHNVTDISQAADTGCIYYGQDPAVAVGDQILFDTTTSQTYAVTIDSQGFYTVDTGGSTARTSFNYYVYDATDETWGAIGTITINEDADPGFSAGSGRALVRPIVRGLAR